MYGATVGKLFAAGRAGDRFCVRNSGALAVVEGCGSNGCEYMTGGVAVILGPVGENFGAGMTSGMAFVYDPDERFAAMVNGDTVVWHGGETAHWEGVLRGLVTEHVRKSHSVCARRILDNWDREVLKFRQIVPKDMLGRLEHPARMATQAAALAE